jgi:TatD DNase family protein
MERMDTAAASIIMWGMNPPAYFDIHCHLDDVKFETSRFQIVKNCLALGYAGLVTVADPYIPGSIGITCDLLENFETVKATIAAHPHEADRYDPACEKRIEALLDHEKCIAVGEAGLDFHYMLSHRENQEKVFRRQIAIAREHQLPLIIHSRKAENEILQILDSEKFEFPVVFHCYTGSLETAREIVNREFDISFSGIITFKKAEELRRVCELVPLNRLFSETDSPYLSPEPHRGEINTPEKLPLIISRIADIKGVAVEDLCEQIKSNIKRTFSKTR